MGERLVVDGALLDSTASRLAGIVTAFDEADTYADGVADAVGDDKLAHAVRDFSRKWKARRAKMRDSIKNVADLTTKASEQFTDTDKQLGAAISGDKK